MSTLTYITPLKTRPVLNSTYELKSVLVLFAGNILVVIAHSCIGNFQVRIKAAVPFLVLAE